jgi:arylsulfatase B
MHEGGHTYFPEPGKHKLMRNGQLATEIREPYLTDWFTSEALDFMKPVEDKAPWFLFLSYNTPHTPMQAKAEDLERFSHISHEPRRTYAAMQWCMDQNIGRILESLNATDQLDNTLIVFFSDNGGRVTETLACNAPLRGMKGSFLEGGIRVPFIWHWPAGLPSGTEFNHPLSSVDLLPTFMAATDAEMPPRKSKVGKKEVVHWDGQNLLPFLKGEKEGPPHERLFWRMVMRGAAVREGKWKLLLNVHTPPALYNLDEDISELHNLYAEHPEIVKKLWDELNAWEESLEDTPHWVEDPYWQGYNRKLYQHEYWLTQPKRDDDYRGLKR